MDSADQRALAETYRDAGLQHITVAREVYDFEWYAPANYLAGLAVECVLRAYRTMIDPAFDARHDLGLLFRLARFGDVIPPQDIVRVSTALDVVVTLWSNDHRFLDESALRRRGTSRGGAFGSASRAGRSEPSHLPLRIAASPRRALPDAPTAGGRSRGRASLAR